MAVLTYEKRQRLPKSAFALPKTREYPIHDEVHARNALARVMAFGTPKERRIVIRKVHQRYPQIDISQHLMRKIKPRAKGIRITPRRPKIR